MTVSDENMLSRQRRALREKGDIQRIVRPRQNKPPSTSLTDDLAGFGVANGADIRSVRSDGARGA